MSATDSLHSFRIPTSFICIQNINSLLILNTFNHEIECDKNVAFIECCEYHFTEVSCYNQQVRECELLSMADDLKNIYLDFILEDTAMRRVASLLAFLPH